MNRTIVRWVVLPAAVLVAAIAIYAGFGLIETIAVAAIAVAVWNYVSRLVPTS